MSKTIGKMKLTVVMKKPIKKLRNPVTGKDYDYNRIMFKFEENESQTEEYKAVKKAFIETFLAEGIEARMYEPMTVERDPEWAVYKLDFKLDTPLEEETAHEHSKLSFCVQHKPETLRTVKSLERVYHNNLNYTFLLLRKAGLNTDLLKYKVEFIFCHQALLNQ